METNRLTTHEAFASHFKLMEALKTAFETGSTIPTLTASGYSQNASATREAYETVIKNASSAIANAQRLLGGNA